MLDRRHRTSQNSLHEVELSEPTPYTIPGISEHPGTDYSCNFSSLHRKEYSLYFEDTREGDLLSTHTNHNKQDRAASSTTDKDFWWETMYDAIVLSGGGTKGLMQLGAIQYYIDKNLIDITNVKHYSGTSIGAAICFLMACGLTPYDILHELLNLESFFDGRDALSFTKLPEKLGLMTTERFGQTIENIAADKVWTPITFQELYEQTGNTLYITATNVSSGKGVVFSRHTHPDLDCVYAVRMSCSLPFIFERMKYKNDYYADGGLTNNFPVEVVSQKRVLAITTTSPPSRVMLESLFPYLYRLMMIPIQENSRMRMNAIPDNTTVVKVHWNRAPFFSLSLSDSEKKNMFEAGWNCAERERESVEI